MNTVTATKADAIRDRFTANAARYRAEAERLAAQGEHTNAAALICLAESHERMAAKRYEAMTVRAI